ncbi:MAG: nucleotide exchange factor GrpE [Anaerolineae bacterium]|nr:nucleotide exchange factor GrpE [Anaerolineae bacterium]
MDRRKTHIRVRRPGEKPPPGVEKPDLKAVNETPAPDELPLPARIQPENVDWRKRALRLEDELRSYRQREALRSRLQLAETRAGLLSPLLDVVDGLERALEQADENNPFHDGVRVTYQKMMRYLAREGVEPIPALGKCFDPTVHAATVKVSAPQEQSEDALVVAEDQRGYRMGERLLRPARVVVAVKAEA